MLFNSLEFVLFLPLTFLLYWFVFKNNLKLQNFFLLVVSYIFYAWWDWRYLFLIIFCAGINFWLGLKIASSKSQNHKRFLLSVALIVSLGLLGIFKYFNFFVDNFIQAFSGLGVTLHPRTLNIILPVGISFFTFQTLSYTIDVYKNKISPTKDLIAFLTFVAFFPQLVAGPIERATNLLPQFFEKRKFNLSKATDGMRQILWGFFKKIVIADTCAPFVDHIFMNYETLPASSLLLGAVFFSFQIYGDFSGYSDIAIGTSRLFGFDLMRNFGYPYFSRNIAEFWRQWHISLTTWFRDYLYIPLGGSRGSRAKVIRNTFIIFIVSGFWHGANWTFILWGIVHALLFMPLLLANTNRRYLNTVAFDRMLPTVREALQMFTTFIVVTIAWIFFRADNVKQAFHFIGGIFDSSIISKPEGLTNKPELAIFFILLLLATEWIQRTKQHGLESPGRFVLLRWILYFVIVILCLTQFKENQDFIYFQF